DGEVHVPGGVDDVDAVLLAAAGPEGSGGGGGDGDAALLLLLHPVHGGGTVMDHAQLVRPAGVIQDALGRSRLPGIDVRHDADVANPVERRGSGHRVPLLSKNAGRPWRPSSGPVSLRHHRGTSTPRCRISRVPCSGTPLACPYGVSLPPVMREGPVGFRHPVRVFLLLDRLAL